ncbi:hypothetical protein [Hymenobacter cellulosivorans]|uniref:Uncharacterized protein n=1 Tax=Hymenobacter cellulosivorans TaxID=2932249 RepID=A0ABY4F9H3_9BACT|nr:hypothetical protein [Hymenobacter cellulosivorans]UOQ53075.1 hypothetical protein MUN80_25475 [Hymenobacter cellulosivorans]
MNRHQTRRRLASLTLAELHQLRRVYRRGKMLERIEAEAMLREMIARPTGNTAIVIIPSKLNYL